MINGKRKMFGKTGKFCILFFILAFFVLLAYLIVPAGASEEYKYTVLKIFQFCFFPLMAIAAILLYCSIRHTTIGEFLEGARGWLLPLIVGSILTAIPFFSPDASTLHWQIGVAFSICWTLGFLGVSLGLFLLAARLGNAFSGLLCLAASLALAFFIGELAYLLTPQYGDGKWSDADHSKYVLSAIADPHLPAKETEFGRLPKKPGNPAGAAAHRELRYDRESFDALYTLTDKDRRVMPKADDTPSADLLLFGCSFTFGFGMNDDQTWPWLLAKDLGPSWRVENYAYSGFGAQQMLLYLEQKKIDPPTAAVRQAVFLAIHDQIRRNSGLFAQNSVSYILKDSGELERGPDTKDSPLRTIFSLPEVFNGSQLAREISHKLVNWLVNRMEPEQTRTYLAIIEKSAKILREQYGTELNVLLWPDIENIAPDLEARGIPVILARKLLKDWDEKGEAAYQIVPVYETHPNTRAARELADGLAAYFREVEYKTNLMAREQNSRQ